MRSHIMLRLALNPGPSHFQCNGRPYSSGWLEHYLSPAFLPFVEVLVPFRCLVER
jgi:hypothetical protein